MSRRVKLNNRNQHVSHEIKLIIIKQYVESELNAQKTCSLVLREREISYEEVKY